MSIETGAYATANQPPRRVRNVYDYVRATTYARGGDEDSLCPRDLVPLCLVPLYRTYLSTVTRTYDQDSSPVKSSKSFAFHPKPISNKQKRAVSVSDMINENSYATNRYKQELTEKMKNRKFGYKKLEKIQNHLSNWIDVSDVRITVST